MWLTRGDKWALKTDKRLAEDERECKKRRGGERGKPLRGFRSEDRDRGVESHRVTNFVRDPGKLCRPDNFSMCFCVYRIRKQSSRVRSWNERWFVLKNGCMYYFRKPPVWGQVHLSRSSYTDEWVRRLGVWMFFCAGKI